MKAAVIFKKGEMPQYVLDFPEPTASGEDIVMNVTAAAVKHLDRSKASGKHYSTKDDFSDAKVIGGDGVGLLADGTRVFALGNTGMLAEKALIGKNKMVTIPDGLDDATAAALPNAVAGSAMALRYRAALKPGDTVLINGATGFTGKIAVQIAKYYGAGKIIVTGRNETSLQALKDLGADITVSLKQSEEDLINQLREINLETTIDIVIDYLWGNSAQTILEALKGKGNFTHKMRFVSVGSVTGDTIQLSSEILRSVDLTISGSGLGSWTKNEMQQLLTEIIPEMFKLAANGKLVVETSTVNLQDIEQLWEQVITDGKRVVVKI